MKLLVCESRGVWAAELRRLLPASAPPLRETRSLTECAAELTIAPTSFVVVELTASTAPQLIEQIADWRQSKPQAAFAVVASRQLASWRELSLEAGASLAIFSPRELAPLITAIQRHAARHPQAPVGYAEQVWAELPLAYQNN